jgi:hypothetical protein
MGSGTKRSNPFHLNPMTSPDIDIHTYPEGADSQTLWRYQAAVMEGGVK